MPIRAVLFDFFGVISIPSYHAFLEQHIQDSVQISHAHELRRQHDLGYISVDDYLQEISSLTGTSTDEVQHNLRSRWVPNEQLVAFMRHELHGRYKLGLLSNAAGDLHALVPEALTDGLLDAVIVSAEVGMVKPHPDIFALACERVGVAPEQAVMIDDIKENCDGAKVAGLQAIMYRSFPQCRNDLMAIIKN